MKGEDNRGSREPHHHPELYAAVLRKIVTGEYPPGSRLIEEELARNFKTSRTPVREVLLALARDGLVERARNRGARVLSITTEDVEQIYEIRKVLECLSIRSAVRNLRLSDLLELEHRLKQLKQHQGPAWQQQHMEIDSRLHRLIHTYSGNRRLIAYLDNIWLLVQSLRTVAYGSSLHSRRGLNEHLAIVRALLRRDVEMAERLMAQHVQRAKQDVLKCLLRRDHRGKPRVLAKFNGQMIPAGLPEDLGTPIAAGNRVRS